jgi:hypothetical protein
MPISCQFIDGILYRYVYYMWTLKEDFASWSDREARDMPFRFAETKWGIEMLVPRM